MASHHPCIKFIYLYSGLYTGHHPKAALHQANPKPSKEETVAIKKQIKKFLVFVLKMKKTCEDQG